MEYNKKSKKKNIFLGIIIIIIILILFNIKVGKNNKRRVK